MSCMLFSRPTKSRCMNPNIPVCRFFLFANAPVREQSREIHLCYSFLRGMVPALKTSLLVFKDTPRYSITPGLPAHAASTHKASGTGKNRFFLFFLLTFIVRFFMIPFKGQSVLQKKIRMIYTGLPEIHLNLSFFTFTPGHIYAGSSSLPHDVKFLLLHSDFQKREIIFCINIFGIFKR